MSVALTATEYGAGPPVAILHGLFGAARNWAGIARRLAQQYRVIALDLRNHGASPWTPAMARWPGMCGREPCWRPPPWPVSVVTARMRPPWPVKG